MPTSIVPEELPLDPEFAGRAGPAVDAARLAPETLRARFRAARSWQTEQDDDGRRFRPGLPLRPAAVLIGLRAHPEGLRVLFTVRAADLADHAGQISFPGGRVEDGDADAVAAALREAAEEVGLEKRYVEVLGTLPVYRTVSGYAITPVVGVIDAQARVEARLDEVAETFEVPLAYLMDGAHHQRRIVVHETPRRCLYTIEYAGARRYMIWGATAALVRNLYRFLLA